MVGSRAYIYIYIYVCVCEWERERERERFKNINSNPFIIIIISRVDSLRFPDKLLIFFPISRRHTLKWVGWFLSVKKFNFPLSPAVCLSACLSLSLSLSPHLSIYIYIYILIYKAVFNPVNPESGTIPRRTINIFKNRISNWNKSSMQIKATEQIIKK